MIKTKKDGVKHGVNQRWGKVKIEMLMGSRGQMGLTPSFVSIYRSNKKDGVNQRVSKTRLWGQRVKRIYNIRDLDPNLLTTYE